MKNTVISFLALIAAVSALVLSLSPLVPNRGASDPVSRKESALLASQVSALLGTQVSDLRARVDSLENELRSATATAEKNRQDLVQLTRTTQNAFNQVGAVLVSLKKEPTRTPPAKQEEP